MKIEEILTKEEKKLIGDTIEQFIGAGVRPVALLGLSQYAQDFFTSDLQSIAEAPALPKACTRIGGCMRDLHGTECCHEIGTCDTDKLIDPCFDEAVSVVRTTGRASTALLQLKLKIGYVHSSRLIDQLEAAGIIGPKDGAKPRKVL